MTEMATVGWCVHRHGCVGTSVHKNDSNWQRRYTTAPPTLAAHEWTIRIPIPLHSIHTKAGKVCILLYTPIAKYRSLGSRNVFSKPKIHVWIYKHWWVHLSHVRHIPLTGTAVNTRNTRLVQYAYRYHPIQYWIPYLSIIHRETAAEFSWWRLCKLWQKTNCEVYTQHAWQLAMHVQYKPL